MIKIQFDTDNAAFQDNPRAELSRIFYSLLEKAVDSIGEDGVSGTITDINGNKVGTFYIQV